MFGKAYLEDRVMIIVRVPLSRQDEGKTEVQGCSEMWVILKVTVRGQVQGPGLGLGLGVQ